MARKPFSGDWRVGLAVAKAASQRVAHVIIGDSNAGFSSYGYDSGLWAALAARFRCCGSMLAPLGIGIELGGPHYSASSTTADMVSPPSYVSNLNTADMASRPTYVAGGGFNYPSQGLRVASSAPGRGVEAMLFEHTFVKFPASTAGGGICEPHVKYDGTPTVVVDRPGGGVSTKNATEEYSIGRYEATLLPGADSTPANTLQFTPASNQRNSLTAGPYAGLTNRVTLPSRTAGFAVTTQHYQGGQPLRQILEAILADPQAGLDFFWGEQRRLATMVNQTPVVVVWIIGGGNDMTVLTNQDSIGRAAIAGAGKSANALVDHQSAIVDAIEGVWIRNGWPLSELHFVTTLVHPGYDGTSENATMEAYRDAMGAHVESRARWAFPDLTQLTTRTAMAAANYYWTPAQGWDYHLANAGYDAMANLMVGCLLSNAAPRDGLVRAVTVEL